MPRHAKRGLRVIVRRLARWFGISPAQMIVLLTAMFVIAGTATATLGLAVYVGLQPPNTSLPANLTPDVLGLTQQPYGAAEPLRPPYLPATGD